MYCTKCGRLLNDTDSFCPSCGKQVTAPMPIVAQPDPVLEKNKEAKRAYNLSTLALIIAMGALTVVSTIGTVVGYIITFLSDTSIISSSSGISDLIYNIQNNLDPTLFQLITLIAEIVGLGGGILLAGILRRKIKTNPPEKKKLSFGQFILAMSAAFGIWGIGVMIGNFPGFFVPIELLDDFAVGPMMWIVSVICAPIFEELLFRKLLIDKVVVYGEGTAVLMSALLFGMAHQNSMQFFLAFGVGLVAATVYVKTGRVIYTILIHFSINMFAIINEIGCLAFGDYFDIIWTIIFATISIMGLLFAFIFRNNDLFKLNNEGMKYRKFAFSGPGFIVAEVVIILSVLSESGLMVLSAIKDYGLISFVHYIPAIIAVVFMLVLPAVERKKSRAVSGPDQDVPNQVPLNGILPEQVDSMQTKPIITPIEEFPSEQVYVDKNGFDQMPPKQIM